MSWRLASDLKHRRELPFATMGGLFAIQGNYLTRDPISKVYCIDVAGQSYYAKQYFYGGKGLKRYFGRSRIRAEWENLRYFRSWGIAVPDVVAWGEERRWGRFLRGGMVTAGLANTVDLASLAKQASPSLKNAVWVDAVSQQVADATRKMHTHGFAHNDLKWRNILVSTDSSAPKVYLIDCPAGTFWYGPFLRYRVIKDLACLDKVAKYQLSRTQRLRFYMQYARLRRLTAEHKKRLLRILTFFAGRE